MLAKAKRLRGGPFDLFGIGVVRSEEKALAAEYRAMIVRALDMGMAPSRLVELAKAPDGVRGYEDVKMRNIESYRRRCAELMAATGDEGGAEVGKPAPALAIADPA